MASLGVKNMEKKAFARIRAKSKFFKLIRNK